MPLRASYSALEGNWEKLSPSDAYPVGSLDHRDVMNDEFHHTPVVLTLYFHATPASIASLASLISEAQALRDELVKLVRLP